MTRSNVRELAVQLIFMSDFTDESPSVLQEQMLQAPYYQTLRNEFSLFQDAPAKKQMAYISELIEGVTERRSELDEYISQYSIGWKLERISHICKAIMRVAMYEILYVEDVPDSVAIHEAVEFARRYEDEDAVAFVNGLLGSFVRGVHV